MSRWDRWWLMVFGAATAAGGVAVLVARRSTPAGRRIVGEPLTTLTTETWFPWATAAAGLALVLIGGAWLIGQLRGHRHRSADLGVPDGPPDAPVRVPSAAVAHAVERDVEALAGVASSSAIVLSDDPPAVEVRVTAVPGCHLAQLIDAINEGPQARLQRSLQRPDAQLKVRVRMSFDAKTPVDYSPGAGYSAASASATSSGTSTLA